MKEKTYYEVLEEMKGKQYDHLETQLYLGETCVELIKRIEDRKDVLGDILGTSKLVTVNGRKYDVKIIEWKEVRYGTDKV